MSIYKTCLHTYEEDADDAEDGQFHVIKVNDDIGQVSGK